jgi:alkylhydroperoxidase family enzyme
LALIDYPALESLAPDIADRLVRLGSLNVTRMMAHAPGVMVAYSKLGSQFLLRGELDPVLREVVILRIGQLCRSDYEWHQHVSVARAVGMDEMMLSSIEHNRFEELPERARLAVHAAEEIHSAGRISPELFADAQRLFSNAELVELSLLAGFYLMTAAFLRSFEVDIETTPPLGTSLPRSR